MAKNGPCAMAEEGRPTHAERTSAQPSTCGEMPDLQENLYLLAIEAGRGLGSTDRQRRHWIDMEALQTIAFVSKPCKN